MSGLTLVPLKDIPRVIQACPTTDLIHLCDLYLQMQEICIQENGIGLSAVQLGIPWNFYVVRYFEESKFRCFVDCKYEPISEDKTKAYEACLSLKGPNGTILYFEVQRNTSVKITGHELIDLTLVPVEEKVFGTYSIVHQHEIDHGFGITIDQIGTAVDFWK